MKKSKLSLGLLLIGCLALAGCSSNQKTSDISTSTSIQSSTEEKDINYTLKVYDLDGTELLNKSLKTKKKDSLFVDLNRESTLESDATDLGHYVISINDSIVDSNYFLAIYQNGKMTSTGIDGVVLADGDEIVIRNECWADFDETDQLVDKAFYQYIRNYLIEDVKDDEVSSLHVENSWGGFTNFTNYWTYCALGILKDNGFDINIKNENQAIYNAVKDYDLTTLSDVDYGKYYYYAKAFDIDLTAYKTKYQDFITNTLPSDYSDGGEWSIPFEIAPAKALNIQSDKINSIINSDYVAGTTYGTDGVNWQYTANLLFGKDKNSNILTTLSQFDYSEPSLFLTPTSVALSIASFAASNESPRKAEYEKDGKDLVENLLENYDSQLGLIKVYSTDEGLNYSTNQIYAALFAYKLQRDKNTAINIFK